MISGSGIADKAGTQYQITIIKCNNLTGCDSTYWLFEFHQVSVIRYSFNPAFLSLVGQADFGFAD
jgi:hypothetical protein